MQKAAAAVEGGGGGEDKEGKVTMMEKTSNFANTGGGMWTNDRKKSGGFLQGRRTIAPLFLMIICPYFVFLVWWICSAQGGDLTKAFHLLCNAGFVSTLFQNYRTPFSYRAWMILGIFMSFALFLTKFLPHKIFEGPPSPTGYVNRYHDNGRQFWFAMTSLFILGSEFGLGIYNAGIIYDNYGEILSSLNIFALVFCSLLYVKGCLKPSSDDSGTTGNFIFDYYFGTELYPNIAGWDVKQFTNSRFGLAWWGIACLSFCAKQYEIYGYVSATMLVTVVLQYIYITKFFWWETGYFCSMDIQHDRAGFYICWGCLVWVPAIYVLSTLWAVKNPINLSWPFTLFLLIVGVAMIMINYDADYQRQAFRKSVGKLMIWGQKPLIIEASYYDEHGVVRHSILLASGWWGIARHFHYIPEILGALCWSPPVQFSYIIPYFYVIFLTILLVDRAYRDDARCLSKYGKYWEAYCKLVPYKLFPFVF